MSNVVRLREEDGRRGGHRHVSIELGDYVIVDFGGEHAWAEVLKLNQGGAPLVRVSEGDRLGQELRVGMKVGMNASLTWVPL
jgi:hypothetical protein